MKFIPSLMSQNFQSLVFFNWIFLAPFCSFSRFSIRLMAHLIFIKSNSLSNSIRFDLNSFHCIDREYRNTFDISIILQSSHLENSCVELKLEIKSEEWMNEYKFSYLLPRLTSSLSALLSSRKRNWNLFECHPMLFIFISIFYCCTREHWTQQSNRISRTSFWIRDNLYWPTFKISLTSHQHHHFTQHNHNSTRHSRFFSRVLVLVMFRMNFHQWKFSWQWIIILIEFYHLLTFNAIHLRSHIN